RLLFCTLECRTMSPYAPYTTRFRSPDDFLPRNLLTLPVPPQPSGTRRPPLSSSRASSPRTPNGERDGPLLLSSSLRRNGRPNPPPLPWSPDFLSEAAPPGRTGLPVRPGRSSRVRGMMSSASARERYPPRRSRGERGSSSGSSSSSYGLPKGDCMGLT